MTRGQANVVGVALLVGITVVSLGALTASVGIAIETNAAAADADRVATDLADVFDPATTGSSGRESVSFREGRLGPVDRELVVRADGEPVARVDADALVFENDETKVAFHAGAVVRGEGENAWFERPPLVTVDEDVLVVGIARLGDDTGSIAGTGGVTARLETNASYDRERLKNATVSLEVETDAPAAWERYLRERGASVEREPGDPTAVVATFDGPRVGYLVVYDLDLEVSGRG